MTSRLTKIMTLTCDGCGAGEQVNGAGARECGQAAIEGGWLAIVIWGASAFTTHRTTIDVCPNCDPRDVAERLMFERSVPQAPIREHS